MEINLMAKEVVCMEQFKPLLYPKRYKGAKGGRGSGKSQFFADCIVVATALYPLSVICIREIQRSIKFSSKKLIENKIHQYGLTKLFTITQHEIRTPHNKVIIFEGMQDHTADSVKSLEDFDIAWVEEAQKISKYSLELLIPTIRKHNSELWFSWNPVFPDDAIEQFFNGLDDSNSTLVHANYDENKLLSSTLIDEANRHKINNPDTYGHVWLGEYSLNTDVQVFNKKFELSTFKVDNSFNEPLFGLDFGFAQDPTAANEIYIKDNVLYIYKEASKIGLELDYTADFIKNKMPLIEKYTIRADCARPESISYLRRMGLPFIKAADKWSGSVEDGIEFMKSFDKIIIHTNCSSTYDEFRKYSYKIDKRTGDILPKIEDKHNHHIDAIRYALTPLIKERNTKTQSAQVSFL